MIVIIIMKEMKILILILMCNINNMKICINNDINNND